MKEKRKPLLMMMLNWMSAKVGISSNKKLRDCDAHEADPWVVQNRKQQMPFEMVF